EKMKGSLLQKDYFLGQPGFVDQLKQEADRPSGRVDGNDLQNAIRIPNALGMGTQLLRGLVEGKPGRYTDQEIDLKSDAFPNGVQLHPPDVRDVELFSW